LETIISALIAGVATITAALIANKAVRVTINPPGWVHAFGLVLAAVVFVVLTIGTKKAIEPGPSDGGEREIQLLDEPLVPQWA